MDGTTALFIGIVLVQRSRHERALVLDSMKLQGFSVGRILDGELVGVVPNHASENPSYRKSL